MKILISGASVAGPVLAYWLHRYGFEPTVVERTPAARHGLGGHAVDLYGAAAEVTRRMGCWDTIEAARTQLDSMTVERFGRRPVEVDLSRIYAGISSRHVEILRGELTKVLYDAGRGSAEYLFGDSIASLHDDGEGVDVTFDSGLRRRFDLVIGADGLHSNVRRLVFGSEEELHRPLGGYLAVFSMPDVFGLGNHTLAHFSVGKLVGIYGVHQTGQVRAGFLFRGDLTYDHRDTDQQKALLVKEFGDYGWKVPQLLEHLQPAEDFYFDSIAQVTLESWVSGRVGLVGDAGYCPGPAVGGGTSLAVVAAYILAGELAAARSDLPSGLRNYERIIRPLVDSSRRLSPKVMGTVIPSNALTVRLMPGAAATLAKLPTALQRLIWSQNAVGKVFSSTALPDYSDLLQPESGQPVP
ncbi:2-polyprenyl-6-methoxyphenol hydroxylase-like FAD-dependent oxidoreductase [Kribbella aluminosa]|uniref:2-polyprenyl-6-methoxyphenol hydroxylase-like FAD-dependent oxidoreductase n=1 Tax=Kribbella aluminosa TaxID=416017 RepID=A0ABS4UY50_9ACTN|nr:FAD-dependent monooxygenase [Kribbella aluminosa]MBP2356565.1 2-polyprenyl-6-methoxyphenol hydroxylase-like FAD-dependent oxidoreductase [Kribbella aluminosa]